MGNVLRGVILAWLAVGMVAGQIVLSPAPGGGGGGATSLDALTDVTITSAADGDGLRHNGTAFVNTALFTAGTSDILAARMQTNVRAAIGAGLTAGRIPRTAGGVLVDDDSGEAAIWVGGQKRFWVDASGHSNIPTGRFFYLGYSTVSIQGTANNMALRTGPGQYIDFLENNQYIVRFGGPDQTALFQDQTATTGITSVVVKGGAGQSTNPVFTVQNNSGTANATILESGAATVASVTMAATGATFYGASANEPVSCSASIDGSIYFDTTDQKLCICANDGTDDEWLMSDDYSHLTGHCSL